ncbi:uncharacterized protein ACWYII_006497 isoform 3-T3 [Salvelinus alpinus]
MGPSLYMLRLYFLFSIVVYIFVLHVRPKRGSIALKRCELILNHRRALFYHYTSCFCLPCLCWLLLVCRYGNCHDACINMCLKMTTRLLASFNVLDNHSKKVLDGHARKNRLLSHAPRCCCASCRKPDLVLPLTVNCDWDFEFPSACRTPISKHKTTTDINVEQEFLHNKLRSLSNPSVSKPATAASSITEDSSCKLKEAVRSRVSVCTFTSPEYLPWKIGHRTGESRGGGRLKRKSVRDGQRHSPVSDSQREEVSPVSDDVTADCVPLSLSEELKRKNVRVLTPRPPSVCLPLPIVSETYPVVCNSDPHHHKPFTSSGHHFLEDPNPNFNPSPNPSRTTLHSAIVRITDSLQADIMVRERREKEGARWEKGEVKGEREKEREKEREREEKQGVAGPHSVSLWVLSADGRVGKASELGQLPLHSNQLSPPPSSRAHLLPPPPPRQKRGNSTAVGPVLNGMNPKMSEPLIGPPDYFRPLPSGTSKRLQTSFPREPITGQMDFLFISKPLKHHHEESMSPLVAKQQASREDWRLGQRHLVMLSEEIDVENIRVYGVRFFLSQLGNKTPRHSTSLYLSEHHSHTHDVKTNSLYDSGMEHTLKTCSSYESGSEQTLRPNFPFDPQQAISIPTAENVLLP